MKGYTLKKIFVGVFSVSLIFSHFVCSAEESQALKNDAEESVEIFLEHLANAKAWFLAEIVEESIDICISDFKHPSNTNFFGFPERIFRLTVLSDVRDRFIENRKKSSRLQDEHYLKHIMDAEACIVEYVENRLLALEKADEEAYKHFFSEDVSEDVGAYLTHSYRRYDQQQTREAAGALF